MKKLKIIALSALAFVTIASMVFVGCQKSVKTSDITENSKIIYQKENEKILVSEIIDISKSYPRNLAKQKQPKGGRVIVADVVGGLAGAAGGPFTAFLGAFGNSLYDLYQQDAFGLIVANSNNETDFIPITNNPYNEIGKLHNLSIVNYAKNCSSNIIDNSNYKSVINFATNEYNETIGTTHDPINYNFIEHYNTLIENYETTGIDGIFKNSKDLGEITENESIILSNFCNNLVNLNITDAIDYSKKCEDVVLISNINSTSKQKILFAIAIGKNSKILYNNISLK
jgi:hypothetical protein